MPDLYTVQDPPSGTFSFRMSYLNLLYYHISLGGGYGTSTLNISSATIFGMLMRSKDCFSWMILSTRALILSKSSGDMALRLRDS